MIASIYNGKLKKVCKTLHYNNIALEEKMPQNFRDNKRPAYIMQDQGDYIWPLEQLHWVLISQQLPQFPAYKNVNQQLQ